MTAGDDGSVGTGAVGPAPVVRVRRLDPRAMLPTRTHPDDAGLDLYTLADVTLAPGDRAAAGTGVAIELPAGHAGLVLPRSGLAARYGLALVNAPGLIDAGYRGELRVLLLNTDREQPITLSAGSRIAQLVVIAPALPPVVEVAELSGSERGAGGFGSTGI
jgi:dUTP pyrophosphatase